MKKWMAVLLCIMMIPALAACSGSGGSGSTTQPTEQSASAEPSMEIATPYCTIRYPDKWKDEVTVNCQEGDPCVVSFVSGDAALFDIVFGGEEGNLLGTLQTQDSGTVAVRLVTYTVDKTNKDYDKLLAMQEDINYVIERLSAEYSFTIGDAVEDDNLEGFEIKADLVTLYYPKRWENMVAVDIADDSVSFRYKEIALFAILFGQESGVQIGSYDGTSVSVSMEQLDSKKLSGDDYQTALLMQEDINYLLDELTADPLFVSAQQKAS